MLQDLGQPTSIGRNDCYNNVPTRQCARPLSFQPKTQGPAHRGVDQNRDPPQASPMVHRVGALKPVTDSSTQSRVALQWLVPQQSVQYLSLPGKFAHDLHGH